VLQEQPDQLPDGGVQVGLGQRLGDQLLAELEEPALTVSRATPVPMDTNLLER
jgi:hypothetical protein